MSFASRIKTLASSMRDCIIVHSIPENFSPLQVACLCLLPPFAGVHVSLSWPAFLGLLAPEPLVVVLTQNILEGSWALLPLVFLKARGCHFPHLHCCKVVSSVLCYSLASRQEGRNVAVALAFAAALRPLRLGRSPLGRSCGHAKECTR